MSKTKDKILEILKDEIKNKPNDVYNLNQINNKTQWEYCLDYIVNNDFMDKITPITRTSKSKSYYIKGHDNPTINENSNRIEELNVLRMFQQKIISDYQVPLKDKKEDKVGKIDFIYEYNDSLYIVEYKKEMSKETLLRCILEIETYYNVIEDKNKFLNDLTPRFTKQDEYNCDKLKKAVCIHDDSYAYENLNATNKNLKILIEKYGITIFIAKKSDDGIFNIELYK